ncbi:MAG: hypothetical protein C7B43_17385 [Sulfobacillus benefaciens]|uniref:Stage 0 sporulation protein A homolog n=1 Tax=Sulfobacillus benefaciens TaxID=453960 RepID=A0A2T2WSF6_9FIRM|nr:MAG: hypothetical protein C7B43_17385 [Sulfobacillus benefaciens]
MNVWIVDDNEDLLELLKRALSSLDWNLYTFLRGAEVLNFVDTGEAVPDVVVLDWTLPDLPAAMVMEHIGTCYPLAQVIVMSGNSRIEEQLPEHAYWIGKPFHLGAFRQMVRDVVSKI